MKKSVRGIPDNELRLAKKAALTVQNKGASPTSDVNWRPAVNLLMIPIELLSQIASSLSPKDLLILARTCKALRMRFMAKSSVGMWERAEELVPGLPACPMFLSSPQYAALAFMSECSLCGSDTKVKLEANLRVRLCEACHISQLVDVWNIQGNMEQSLINHLSLTTKVPIIPSEHRPFIARKCQIETPHCLKKDLETLYSARESFLRSGDLFGLNNWEWNERIWIEIYDKFASKLERFVTRSQLVNQEKALLEGINDEDGSNTEEDDGQTDYESVDDEDADDP
ncbi:hypothetical protein FRC08_004171 [Ceratobasidium sp. 394]|nr:hypothetical protein FRC08_004171 [Ceratobasidium sp. 394]